MIATVPIGQAPQAPYLFARRRSRTRRHTRIAAFGRSRAGGAPRSGAAGGRARPIVSHQRHAVRPGTGASAASISDRTTIEAAQYVLALSHQPDGGGILEPLAEFTTNPAGSAIANSLGPIRQVVQGEHDVQRHYLVIVPGTSNRQSP